MRGLSACLAAVWLPLSQPLLVSSVAAGATVLAVQAPAHAQSAEAVGKIAEAVTVRIEGATQGSGVLVRREGNRYTVLTAWHVLSGQKRSEEIDVITPDGLINQADFASIRVARSNDLATIQFSSKKNYELANISDYPSQRCSDRWFRLRENGVPYATCRIYVSGFPSELKPSLVISPGRLLGMGDLGPSDDYSILYSNPTLPGMSGGAVLTGDGIVIGIHTRGELKALSNANESTRSSDEEINQGILVADYCVVDNLVNCKR